MNSLIYELIFVLSSAMGVLSVLSRPLGIGKVGVLLILAELLLASLFVVFKNSGLTGRLVSVGLLFTYSVFVILLWVFGVSFGDFFVIKLLWLLPAAFISFVIGEAFAYFRLFQIIASILLLAALILLSFFKVDIDKTFAVSAFSLLLLTVCCETQRHWKKKGNTEIKEHMVFISPFILLTILLLLVSPYSKDPYEWKYVKMIYKEIKQNIYDMKIKMAIDNEKDYAEALMGFSEENDLAGSVKASKETALTLRKIPEGTENLKLSGKNFSTFTGREWIDEDYDDAPDSMMDTMGMMAAMKDYNNDSEIEFQTKELYVRYMTMNTSYVFTPPKALVRKSNFPIYSYEIENYGSDVLWPSDKSYKTSYYISYIPIDEQSEEYAEFIVKSDTPSKESYEAVLEEMGLNLDKMYSYDNFLKHQEYIEKTYCEDVVLSDELKYITKDLYEGCENDYEKLIRIKQLLNSFEYTMKPGELPEYVKDESDFLDYFILESREGYCSFYATAFVLLARAEGIPARYVQGYNVNTESKQAMYVYSSMAHAWAEVYFEGAGWVTFEVTPGYEKQAYNGPSYPYYTLPSISDSVSLPEEVDNTESEEVLEEAKVDTSFRWYVAAIPVISGILLVSVFFFAIRFALSLKFKKLSYERQYVLIIKQILKILRLLGAAQKEGETYYEYKVRLIKDDTLSDAGFIDNLERFLYGPKCDSEKMRGALEDAFATKKEVLNLLKNRHYLKYVLYSIGLIF